MGSQKLYAHFQLYMGLAPLTLHCLKVNCPSNEQSENEINETIPFTVVSRVNLFLNILFSKRIVSKYTENYKTLLKETKEDLHKWKAIPYSWMENSILFLTLRYFPNWPMQSLSKFKLPFLEKWTRRYMKNSYGNARDNQAYHEKEGQNWQIHTSQFQNLS